MTYNMYMCKGKNLVYLLLFCCRAKKHGNTLETIEIH